MVESAAPNTAPDTALPPAGGASRIGTFEIPTDGADSGEIDAEAGVARKVAAFTDELADTLWAIDMFDSLPDVYFYVKDRQSRWIVCNEASMRLIGVRPRHRVHGLTEHDFFPKAIADAIHADDREVIRAGSRIIGKTEVILDERGLLTWVSTNKLPLRDRCGNIVGLMGTTRILRRCDELPETYQPFRRAIDYIEENLASPISIETLSDETRLSVSQFRKRFRSLFGIAPNEFILRTRLQRAARLLVTTEDALIKVALDCGFCDQSYFTKRFRDFFGVTPRRYRRIAPQAVGTLPTAATPPQGD
jgi:AraC-like DNA-binding protein